MSQTQSSPRTEAASAVTGAGIMQLAGKAALSAPVLFVIVFFFVPMIWLVGTSMSPHALGVVPHFTGTPEQYERFWLDPFYLEKVLWTTIRLSLLSTFFSVVIGYVLAYYIASLPASRRGLITSFVVVSLSISIIIRIFGINVLLMNNGLVNNLLVGLGLPRMRIMYTELGVLIGLVQTAVPFVVLPLIGVIAGIDPALKEAASSVGANRFRTFWAVTFPLSMPGVIAGTLIVFSFGASAFAIPALMGGGRVRMMGAMAYEQASIQSNIPFAAAVGVSLTVLSLVITAIYLFAVNRFFKRIR